MQRARTIPVIVTIGSTAAPKYDRCGSSENTVLFRPVQSINVFFATDIILLGFF